MGCRLCGSELGGAPFDAGRSVAFFADVVRDPYGLTCGLCGTVLPASQFAVLFLEKLRQLAQFGLTSNASILSDPSRAEN